MNVKLIYRLSGYLSIVVGILATMCIYRIQYIRLGVGLAIIGFIFSIINISLNVKYFSEQESMPKGYFGMFFSSLPVIFMMLIIFGKSRFKYVISVNPTNFPFFLDFNIFLF